MSVRDLILWGRSNNQTPGLYREDDRSPFLSPHREVNRLFDNVFRAFDSRLPAVGTLSHFNVGCPNIEISETDKEIKVTAEIPALEEKDIEAFLDKFVLMLQGKKRAEADDKDRQFSERFYGRFERRIPVGLEVEEDKIDARFRNGVLTLVYPRPKRPGHKSSGLLSRAE